MTFTLLIVLNLGLSILAMLVVYGCVLLAHRLPDEPVLNADWRDWGHPLPVALFSDDLAAPAADLPYEVAA